MTPATSIAECHNACSGLIERYLTVAVYVSLCKNRRPASKVVVKLLIVCLVSYPRVSLQRKFHVGTACEGWMETWKSSTRWATNSCAARARQNEMKTNGRFGSILESSTRSYPLVHGAIPHTSNAAVPRQGIKCRQPSFSHHRVKTSYSLYSLEVEHRGDALFPLSQET